MIMIHTRRGGIYSFVRLSRNDCPEVGQRGRDLGKPFERKSLTGRPYLRGPDKLEQNSVYT